MPAKLQPIQSSFAGGVLSHRMWSRSDLDGYAQSLKAGENWIVYPQGPVDFRTGFKFRKRLAGSATYGRIIPFAYSSSEAYVIVITTDEIRVLSTTLSMDATLATPYDSDAKIAPIQYGLPPGEDKLVLVNGLTAPQKIEYGAPFTTAVQGFTNAPAEWTGTVYPKTIGHADGRAWYANIVGDPERYWGSKSGSFYNMDTGTALANEAIDRVLDERGAIQWINKSKDLTFGTESGVYRITAEGSVITPSDIQATLESAESSLFAQAVKASGSSLHISPDGRKLREFTYKFDTIQRQWVSKDLSFLSDDLTAGGNTIKRVAYAADPDSIVWCATDLGKLLGVTYNFQNDLYGWHPHALAEAAAELVDICSVKVNGVNQLWGLVKRNAGLEVVTLGDEYLDFYATQSSGTDITSIGPFTHLAEEEVTVMVDGAHEGLITLDASGNGTVTKAGKEFVVGKSYDGEFTSLDIDKGDPEGSPRGLKKRWNKLYISIYESALPKINGTRPPTRSASTPMGEVEPLTTEYVQATTFDFTRGGNVVISQDLPFKTTVLSFVGSMKQN